MTNNHTQSAPYQTTSLNRLSSLDTLSDKLKARLSRISYVLSDTDNTMISHSCALCSADGTPSFELAKALVLARKHNISIVPCTGRNRAMIREDARLLGLSQWIGEMGGIICTKDGAESVWEYACADMEYDANSHKTPHDMIMQTGVVDALLKRWSTSLELYNDNGLGYQYREVTVALRGKLDEAEAQDMLDHCGLALDLVNNGVVTHINGPTILARNSQGVATNISNYHIVPKNLNKGYAVAQFMRMMNLSREQVLACGDSSADCSMAQSAGLFVLMQNGAKNQSCMQELAGADNAFVTERPSTDGFCDLIHLLCACQDEYKSTGI